MTRTRALAALVGALVLLVFGAVAAAFAGDDPARTAVALTSTAVPTSTATRAPGAPAGPVGADDEQRIEVGRVGGAVTRVEAEVEHGRPEWKVEVVAAGRETEVRVDAQTGAVTRVRTDDRLDSGRSDDGRSHDGRGRGRGSDDG